MKINRKAEELNVARCNEFMFETQRLLLKPILESELNALHNIFIDPYVRKYLCDNKVWSLQQVEKC